MRSLSHGEFINAVQAIRGRTDLSERERARRINKLMEEQRGNKRDDRSIEGNLNGSSGDYCTRQEGGASFYQTSKEIRVPHILWIALFWSIVMMFIAENFIP
jgi:hypothetical protein